MAKSAPQISFTDVSIDYTTVDVAGSSAYQTYGVFGHTPVANSSYANAINMSISFKGSYQASEAKSEGWIFVSTASGPKGQIGSIGDPAGIGTEIFVGSIVAGLSSAVVMTFVSIPAGATAAGHVGFYLHHRYQYTG